MLSVVAATLMLSSCAGKRSYETVDGDPMQSRIYTLDNGLKVYLTVNKETPRIQTYIPVRVGGKNDPAETTGLAHYFEHLMFKGTENFGTQNYAEEKPLLDQIEALFEVYRTKTDEAERTAIYRQIDSLSYEASKLSIPNEYDKLMSAIGANGTNAYTSFDVTCYTEDIPSNQVENWARIQADRFANNVIRGFHTELETVYEEKNMSLTRDSRKVSETLLAALFPNHPYGKQTVLGTQDHLKNPSITNIKNYYKNWYVPNNMAICLSGDFDPDQMIATIEKHFGTLQPNPGLKRLEILEQPAIDAPIVKEVLGLDAENIALAWRIPGAANKDTEAMQMAMQILYNGQAGLIDLDVNQPQKALRAYGYLYSMADHGMVLLQGSPKQGQTLDEVKELLLAEVNKLRNGEFDEKLLEATINNYKRNIQYQLEDNGSRADMFVNSFVNGTDWADEVTSIDRLSQLTKQDIVALANKYLGDANYAVVYKRMGKDPNEKKIDKPAITPIVMNRDAASNFLKEIQASTVAPIEPQFVDYEKELSFLTAKADIPVIYKKNETNGLFTLNYVFEMSDNNDKKLSTAARYLTYLGTGDMTVEEIKNELYRLACDFRVSMNGNRTMVMLSGLAENMPAALALLEKRLADSQVDTEAYQNLVASTLKNRANAKLNQAQNFARLRTYATYGPKNGATNLLSEQELKSLNPQELIDCIKALNGYKHRITYYGPATADELIALINKEHRTPDTLADVPAAIDFKQQQTPANQVLIAPYDAKQIYFAQYSNRGEKFDAAIEPARRLYNEYFSGGMNAIVFQEMRESRGLAYSASAAFSKPSELKDNYAFGTYIATQNDKMMDAIATFNDIVNNIPQSEKAFDLAKEGMIARLRTERILGESLIYSYLSAQDFGQTVDSRIALYNYLQTATLADVVKFQEEWIKNRTYTYCILGDKSQLDMAALKKVGPVKELTTKDIFGY